MLSSQTQIAWLKIATASRQVFRLLKVLTNFKVLINEITKLSMHSGHMHCVSLSIDLSIHLSIYISLSRYVCVYIFIYHSIYLSLYMIIIKGIFFQIEQLKLWKKQNILCFENVVILR